MTLAQAWHNLRLGLFSTCYRGIPTVSIVISVLFNQPCIYEPHGDDRYDVAFRLSICRCGTGPESTAMPE